MKILRHLNKYCKPLACLAMALVFLLSVVLMPPVQAEAVAVTLTVGVSVMVALLLAGGITFASLPEARQAAAAFLQTLSQTAQDFFNSVSITNGKILLTPLLMGSAGYTWPQFWQLVNDYFHTPAESGEAIVVGGVDGVYLAENVSGISNGSFLYCGSPWSVVSTVDNSMDWHSISNDVFCTLVKSSNTVYVIVASSNPLSTFYCSNVSGSNGDHVIGMASCPTYKFNSSTTYYKYSSFSSGVSSAFTDYMSYEPFYSISSVSASAASYIKDIAWAMVYGENSPAGESLYPTLQEGSLSPTVISTGIQELYNVGDAVWLNADTATWEAIANPDAATDAPIPVAQTQTITIVEGLDAAGEVTNMTAVLDAAVAAEGVLDDYRAEGIRDGVPISLTEIFPFCIPFDIYDFLAKLQATREAPSVTVPGTLFGSAGEGHDIVIDLSAFDTVATVLRTVELLAFIVGLGFVTREKFLRG